MVACEFGYAKRGGVGRLLLNRAFTREALVGMASFGGGGTPGRRDMLMSTFLWIDQTMT